MSETKRDADAQERRVLQANEAMQTRLAALLWYLKWEAR